MQIINCTKVVHAYKSTPGFCSLIIGKRVLKYYLWPKYFFTKVIGLLFLFSFRAFAVTNLTSEESIKDYYL